MNNFNITYNTELFDYLPDDVTKNIKCLINIYNTYYLNFFQTISNEIFNIKGDLAKYQKETAYYKLNHLLFKIYKYEECRKAIFIDKKTDKAAAKCKMNKRSLELFFNNFPNNLIYESQIDIDTNYLPISNDYMNFKFKFNVLNSPGYLSKLYESNINILLDKITLTKIYKTHKQVTTITNKMFNYNKTKLSKSFKNMLNTTFKKNTNYFIKAILYNEINKVQPQIDLYKAILEFELYLENDLISLENLLDYFGDKFKKETIKNDKKKFVSKLDSILKIFNETQIYQ